MHTSFLDDLVDPETKSPLALDAHERDGDVVREGSLRSPTNEYPIVRGIPRFAGFGRGGDYTKSFGYQWNRWSRVQFESENRGLPMAGHTTMMWEKITALESSDLSGTTVAEFGCGPGRFIDVVRAKGGRAVGLDLSEAVEAAGENFRDDADVLICQADILRSPLRDHAMDGAFSIGVLHHTPDPRAGFRELVRSVRPQGWVAVAVYGKGGYYDFPTVRAYRAIFKALWPIFGHRAPLAYSYLAAYCLRPLSRTPGLGLLVRAAFPFVRLPDARWSLLDTFDSVTPTYQSAHESYEVYRWLAENGLSAIAPSDWGFTAYHGVAPNGEARGELASDPTQSQRGSTRC